MTYNDLKDEQRSFADKINEELIQHGFDSSIDVNSHTIRINTIAGTVHFICGYHKQTKYMSEFYRAVHHIGCKLSRWGLENKIKEQRDENSFN